MSSYYRHVSIVYESLALNDHDGLSTSTSCRGLLISIHVSKSKVWLVDMLESWIVSHLFEIISLTT